MTDADARWWVARSANADRTLVVTAGEMTQLIRRAYLPARQTWLERAALQEWRR